MAIKDYLHSEIKGKILNTKDKFPYFKNLIGHDFSFYSLDKFENKQKVIIFFPSVNTSICETQLKKLAEALDPEKAVLIGISNDSPMDLSQWCATENTKNVIGLSLFNNDYDLAKRVGVFIPGLEAITYRAVFIVDVDGRIKYLEYAKTLKTPLNLEAVIALAK